MTTLTGSAADYNLDSDAGRKAFAAHLMAQTRRQQLYQRVKIGLVWLALFAILGVALALLNVDYAYIFQHAGFVVEGIWLTLGVSLLSIAIATVIALFGALGRISPYARSPRGKRFLCLDLSRHPAVGANLIIYLGLPQIGQQLAALGYQELSKFFILTALQSGVLALSLNYGAYMTEIFRASIHP